MNIEEVALELAKIYIDQCPYKFYKDDLVKTYLYFLNSLKEEEIRGKDNEWRKIKRNKR